MRHLIIAMLVLQSSVCASQSGSGTFRLWVTSDAHVAYDLDKNGRLSIADAIEQSEGKYEKSGYPAFDWDVMLHLGDIFGQYPDDPEGQLIVSQFNAGKSHSREQIYNIMGNHDASGVSQPENWVYRKWIDPMGNNEKYSGVDSNKRPYPVSGTYERYSFEVGNILFLMLSDRNDFDYAHGGRDTSILGYPAGKVTLETYLWWEEKVRNNQDKIIITCHHHMLKNTTTASGPFEGEKYHQFSTHGYRKGLSYLYFVGDEVDSDRFTNFLDNSGNSIAMWLGGHTHPAALVDYSGGKGLRAEKYGVTFMNVAALSKVNMARSYLLTFKAGRSTVKIEMYLHTELNLRKGWQKDLEWEMQIPFKFSPPGVNKLNQNLNPFISLYPNPTNDQLTLEFSSSLYLNGNLSFRLYNIMGDEVRIIENIDRDKILMPKDGLPAGLYLYQLFKNDTIMARGKVVVQ